MLRGISSSMGSSAFVSSGSDSTSENRSSQFEAIVTSLQNQPQVKLSPQNDIEHFLEEGDFYMAFLFLYNFFNGALTDLMAYLGAEVGKYSKQLRDADMAFQAMEQRFYQPSCIHVLLEGRTDPSETLSITDDESVVGRKPDFYVKRDGLQIYVQDAHDSHAKWVPWSDRWKTVALENRFIYGSLYDTFPYNARMSFEEGKIYNGYVSHAGTVLFEKTGEILENDCDGAVMHLRSDSSQHRLDGGMLNVLLTVLRYPTVTYDGEFCLDDQGRLIWKTDTLILVLTDASGQLSHEFQEYMMHSPHNLPFKDFLSFPWNADVLKKLFNFLKENGGSLYGVVHGKQSYRPLGVDIDPRERPTELHLRDVSFFSAFVEKTERELLAKRAFLKSVQARYEYYSSDIKRLVTTYAQLYQRLLR